LVPFSSTSSRSKAQPFCTSRWLRLCIHVFNTKHISDAWFVASSFILVGLVRIPSQAEAWHFDFVYVCQW
jgi:hypothetical protein